MMIALMVAVAAHTACFAGNNGSNEQVKTAAKEMAQKVKDAPAGTTYSVVEATRATSW